MKIKILASLAIFLLLFTSCGSPAEQPAQPDASQTQDTGDAGQAADGNDAQTEGTQQEETQPPQNSDKMSEYRYAGTLDKIGEDYIDVTSDGEQNRFQVGARVLRDIESLGITEGMRVIVEFDNVGDQKMVTLIEKIVSE